MKYLLSFHWNGGANYSADPTQDREYAWSMAEVLRVCRSRQANADGRTPLVRYAPGDTVAYVFPAVSEGCKASYPFAAVVASLRGGFSVQALKGGAA